LSKVTEVQSSASTGDAVAPRLRAEWVAGLLGCIFLAWAILVWAAVMNFGDPIAKSTTIGNLSHIGLILTHLPRNFFTLFGVALFMFGAFAPGILVLHYFPIRWRGEAERLAFALGIGIIVLTIFTFALGYANLLVAPVLWSLVLVCCAGTSIEGIRAYDRYHPTLRPRIDWRSWNSERVFTWIACAGLVFYAYLALLGALTPEVGFDARYYHLAEAKRYAIHHGFFDLVGDERIWAFGLPHYKEVLYTFMFSILGMTGAKIIAWFDGALAVGAIIIFCRVHFRSTLMGLIASLIFLSTPIVTWSMATANNDLTLVPFGILGMHAFLRWLDDRNIAWIAILGAIAGYSYGVKSFGGITAIAFLVLLGIAVYRAHAKKKEPPTVVRRSLFTLLGIYSLAAFVCALPMFVHAYQMTGNPVFPFLSGLFTSTKNDANLFGSLLGSHISSGLNKNANPISVITLPWTITVNSDTYRDILGPIYLLALPVWIGICWLASRTSPALRWTLIFVALWSAMAWLSSAIEARYAQVPLALSAVLIAFVLVQNHWTTLNGRLFRVIFAVVVGISILFDNELVVPMQRHALAPGVMGLEFFPYDYLYGDEPESAVQLAYVPDLMWINAHLGPRDKIYDGTGDLMLFNVYSDIDLFNGRMGGSPTASGTWSLFSPDALARLHEEHVTYVDVYTFDVPKLKASPLWLHLRQVFTAPGIHGKGYEHFLFKLID
jgi:hypothetical protein